MYDSDFDEWSGSTKERSFANMTLSDGLPFSDSMMGKADRLQYVDVPTLKPLGPGLTGPDTTSSTSLPELLSAHAKVLADWINTSKTTKSSLVCGPVLDNETTVPFETVAAESSIEKLSTAARSNPEVTIHSALPVGVWSSPLAQGECTICMQDLMDLCAGCSGDNSKALECVVHTGTCGHSYHEHCRVSWDPTKCPLCTRAFSLASATKPMINLISEKDRKADKEARARVPLSVRMAGHSDPELYDSDDYMDDSDF